MTPEQAQAAGLRHVPLFDTWRCPTCLTSSPLTQAHEPGDETCCAMLEERRHKHRGSW